MKYSIFNNIRCPNIYHQNFKGVYSYTSMNDLANNLVALSIWDKEVEKNELPLVCMTTFNHRIRAEYANPSYLFALDFDDEGNDIEKVTELFRDNAFFLYTTSSHTPDHHKFRVMLKLDIDIQNNIESHMVFYIIQDRLKKAGLTLDAQCKDISRRFYLPAYSKLGELPEMVFNEGDDYNVSDELVIKLKEKMEADKQREMASALAKMQNLTKKPALKNVDKKIDEAKDRFISSPSHESLGKVIGSLKFWEVDDNEIAYWCYQNYNPSTGSCEQEVRNWMRWFDGRTMQTYSEKYGT